MIRADLTGKRALVTGGASGIGLACAMTLAEMGATVAINHLEDDPAGPAKVAELSEKGLKVISAPGNVSIPGNAEAMVQAAVQEMGGLDYLINNAGTSGTQDKIPPSELDKMTEEFWQLLLATNLIGPFRCAHAAAGALKEERFDGVGGDGGAAASADAESHFWASRSRRLEMRLPYGVTTIALFHAAQARPNCSGHDVCGAS